MLIKAKNSQDEIQEDFQVLPKQSAKIIFFLRERKLTIPRMGTLTHTSF